MLEGANQYIGLGDMYNKSVGDWESPQLYLYMMSQMENRQPKLS